LFTPFKTGICVGYGFDFLRFALETKSESSLWWKPMAWAIIWGLAFNTLLTLVVVPTFYYAWEKMKERRGWRFKPDAVHLEEPAHAK
jgi:multidrug efflux pump